MARKAFTNIVMRWRFKKRLFAKASSMKFEKSLPFLNYWINWMNENVYPIRADSKSKDNA
jgi:hypothetical protein